MSILNKMLKNCDKTIMSELGFEFKKDRFYRLHNRSFQEIIFRSDRAWVESFQIYYGISFLSGILHTEVGGYSYSDLTGEDYNLYNGNWGDVINREPYTFTIHPNTSMKTALYFDRNSQEISNKIFNDIFTVIRENIVPILDQITDESSFVNIGEKISGEKGMLFHAEQGYIDTYALIGRFEEAYNMLNKNLKGHIEAGEENYKYFMDKGNPERAKECLVASENTVEFFKNDLEAMKNHDIEYFRKKAATNEEISKEFLRKEYKIKIQ